MESHLRTKAYKGPDHRPSGLLNRVAPMAFPESRNKALAPSSGPDWRELYKTAMLELDPESVPGRVAVAREFMGRRLTLLENNRHQTMEERWEIADAMSALKFWEEFSRE
jgi:hypothetical protein